MDVRPHLSQHETAERLPLLTESAAVTAVEPMDRSRNDAVIRELRETLEEGASVAWRRERPDDHAACRRWIRDHLDQVDRGIPLNQYLTEVQQKSERGRKLAALQDRYLRPYPSLIRITVETDDPVEFVPGQYLCLRYGGTTRPYSVASSPNRNEVEFCVRRVPGGRLTPDLSTTLSEGDTVTLRGPYGEFVMERPSHRDMVFLATGTGVAPFRSMIDYCFEEGRDVFEGRKRDVWLFLGVAWRDDIPYREHFQALANEHANFHFVPTLSRERYLSDWQGETAYVQHALVKYLQDGVLEGVALPREFARYADRPPRTDIDARLEPQSMEVYACGINAMVYGLVEAVERFGVPENHTQFEGFG